MPGKVNPTSRGATMIAAVDGERRGMVSERGGYLGMTFYRLSYFNVRIHAI